MRYLQYTTIPVRKQTNWKKMEQNGLKNYRIIKNVK